MFLDTVYRCILSSVFSLPTISPYTKSACLHFPFLLSFMIFQGQKQANRCIGFLINKNLLTPLYPVFRRKWVCLYVCKVQMKYRVEKCKYVCVCGGGAEQKPKVEWKRSMFNSVHSWQ